MPWFMTPYGPQHVIEPGTIEEFERRDYVSLTAQQAADYFAGVAFPDPPSFATEAEVPGIMATVAADAGSAFSVAQRAAFGAQAADPTSPLRIEMGKAYAVRTAKVSDLTYPLVIPHRGGGNIAPEHTMAAYELSMALGAQAVEAADLQFTSDGLLVASHDTTADRMTYGSGPWSQFSAGGARRQVSRASVYFGGNWPDQPVVTFDEILDRIGGRIVIVPQVNGDTAGQTRMAHLVCQKLIARGMEHSAIVAYISLAVGSVISSYGIASMFSETPAGDTNPATVAATGSRFVAVNFQTVPNLAAVVAGYHAAGVKVIAYTPDRQVDYDACIAAGVDGVYSDDPFYASRDYASYRTATSPWTVDGTFGHGMRRYPGAVTTVMTPALRGSFLGAPGAYRWKANGSEPLLVGPVSPVANAAGSYTITAALAFDKLNGTTVLWPGIYFAAPDDSSTSGTDVWSSYIAFLRENGNIQLSRVAANGAGTALGTVTTSAIVNPVLSAGLASGAAITSLPVAALASAVKAGHQFILPTGQVATVSTDTAATATAIPVNSITPSAAVTSGAQLIQLATLTIAVTPTTLTLTRADEPAPGSVTATDSAFRGGHIFYRDTTFSGSTAFSSLLSVAIS